MFLIYYLRVSLKLPTSVGLPENMTETIIQEIFERCGEITTLRLSKKNFCHIRFVLEASVDAAIYLSGYRVRIGSNGDSANTGRLHVDFAQVRYKCTYFIFILISYLILQCIGKGRSIRMGMQTTTITTRTTSSRKS